MKYAQNISGYLALFIIISYPFLSSAQLSPGDLAEVHAHLEGLSNCTQCHVLNQKVANEKCLACHDFLNERISLGKGYHASSDVSGKECIKCHSDHHGRKFQMIRFDTVDFKHDLTGYNLEGAHTKPYCGQCHQNRFITDPEIRKLKRTFLGLGTNCLNCHDDQHDKTLSVNCMDCHTYESFKTVPNFNHSSTSFPLVGKHRETDCEKCHPVTLRNEKEFQVFNGMDFGKCTDCHEDIHNNKFGQDCKKCHTEQSFLTVVGMSLFDHSKTGYLLEGKHLHVACEKCHPSKYTNPVAHNLCMDCHDDYHESQFRRNGNLPDCANCHSVEGFQPSIYTLEEHQAGTFPLEGAHLATPCFSCHKKEDKWQFREIGLSCAECHIDIHQPYLHSKYYPDQSCKSCHSLESWTDIGFDHNKTNYSLSGGHLKPSCRACHQNVSQSGENILKFSGISDKCTNCHDDSHAGQFVLNGEVECSNCHDNFNWKASLFDHSQSRFVLDGSHIQVSCAECHKPTIINEVNTIQYKFEDIRCESCHL